LQKEIVEWVLVEVLKILFIRMLLRKIQNVSTSYKSILNLAFLKHNQKLVFNPQIVNLNSKSKLAFQNYNQELATFFDYFYCKFFFFVPFFFKRGTRLGKFILKFKNCSKTVTYEFGWTAVQRDAEIL
jgi:hypothetical protein